MSEPAPRPAFRSRATATDRVLAVLEPLRPLLKPWPGVLPSQVGDRVMPLPLDADDMLAALLPSADALPILDRALQRYVRTDAYLSALTMPRSVRHDLAGRAIAPVSADDVNAAAGLLAERRARRAEHRAAAAPVQPMAVEA